MKSPHSLLTLLLALTFGSASIHSQTTTTTLTGPSINPNAKECCTCFDVIIGGISYPQESLDISPDADGNYIVTVDVSVLDKCKPTSTTTGVTVDSVDVVSTVAGIEPPVLLSENRYKITPTSMRGNNGKFKVVVGCKGSSGVADTCEIPFSIGGGCSSCAGGNCEGTLTPQTENSEEGLIVKLPVPSSIAGVDETLRYQAEEFAYGGPTALVAPASTAFQVAETSYSPMPSPDGPTNSPPPVPAFSSVSQGEWSVSAEETANQTLRIVHSKNASALRTTHISFVEENGVKKHRMDSKIPGSAIRHEQTNPEPGVFVLEKGKMTSDGFAPLWQERLTKTTPIAGTEVRRRIVKERPTAASPWHVVSDVETTRQKLLMHWVDTKEVIDPDGAALTSTWTYYQPGEITGANGSTKGLGEVKRHVRHDGHETFYTYGHNLKTVTTPFAGNPVGRVTTTTWDPGSKTQTVTVTINGQISSKNITIHEATKETNISYSTASGTTQSVTHYMPSNADFGGKPSRVVRSDGTIAKYSYTRRPCGGMTTVAEQGVSADGTTVTEGTRTTTAVNSRNKTILNKAETIGTHCNTLQSMAVTSVDDFGRALTTAYDPTAAEITGQCTNAIGAAQTTTTEYSCCGMVKEIDRYGIPTYYARDGLQREIKTNRLGVTTETVRNGLTTETHRYAEVVAESLSHDFSGTAATLVSKSVTNLAGTLQESWSPDPTSATPGALVKSTTTTSFKPAAGLSTRTVSTTPDNVSQTTDSFLDGRTYRTYGALSPAMEYGYSVNATGEVTSQSFLNTENLKLETTSIQSDWEGRTISTTHMDGATSTTTYNAIGQVVKTTDPDGVATLFAYNDEGERTITAIDLNANGTIDYGVDTVSSSLTEPATVAGKNGQQSISKIWQPGDTSPTGGTITSTSFRSEDGLFSSSQSLGVANPSTSQTVLGCNGNWTVTSTSPDGTKQTQTYTAGRLVSSTTFKSDNTVLHTTTYTYDALNRPIGQTDSRTGTTVTNYLSTTSDTVTSVTAPGERTTFFTYDVRGRRIQVNAPDSLDSDGNTLANVTTTTYNSDSTVAETNGDQTYRTTHTYDYAQRQVTMTTYGTTTATTYWHFSPTRGFLTRKAYHDGKGTDYTYTAAGRLSTRGWARAVGTSYAYDNGGRLINTTYSDDTPDVTVAYDCLGRQTSQTNGTATTTYSYDSATLALDTETIAYNLDGQPGADFTRAIDRSRDNLGRDTGWTLGAPASAGFDNQVTYSYGPTDGRLASVSGGGFQPPSPFHYSYLPNSNLLSTITGPTHTVTNTWEATRDVLATKENKVGSTVISGYTYNVNHLGQRTGVNTAGTAFAATGTINWGYNNKGEVVKADSSVNASDRSYQYDGIGNRLKSADSLTLPTSNNYTPNALNQYSSLTVGTSGPLVPSYDDDGNATAYPLPANVNANSTLTWDAENRLISTTVNSVTTTYLYDSQSRRIAQTTGTTTTLYVYDGWNPIAEYNQSGTGILPVISKTYTWGMDLSGSMQGAGGVGGLLAVTDTTGGYFPTYDGNGNVSEYLDATGSVAAHYEYDPFGKETVSNGTNPSGFAHRFSTKPLDITTGLLYYGYRYYDPVTGRWPSRDPIEEAGGINLYGFVGNNGLNAWDYIGLENAWKTLKMDKSHWTLMKSTETNDADYDFKNNIMILTGGVAVAVYAPAQYDGPSTDALPVNCTIEIKFQYNIVNGENSGFYFAIPPDATNSEKVDAGGREVQIATASYVENYAEKIAKLEKLLIDENNKTVKDLVRIKRLENTINLEKSRMPGGIYNQKGYDVTPKLNADWNSMHVEMNMRPDSSGMEVKVTYNNALVNTYQSDKKSPGRIGFQGHDSKGEVHIKDVQWRASKIQ